MRGQKGRRLWHDDPKDVNEKEKEGRQSRAAVQFAHGSCKRICPTFPRQKSSSDGCCDDNTNTFYFQMLALHSSSSCVRVSPNEETLRTERENWEREPWRTLKNAGGGADADVRKV